MIKSLPLKCKRKVLGHNNMKTKTIFWLSLAITAISVSLVGCRSSHTSKTSSSSSEESVESSDSNGGKKSSSGNSSHNGKFEADFSTKQEAFDNANEVTEHICEEGMILLKNRNYALPLNARAKVSVFGKNSVNLVYGGSGSAAPSGGERKTIFDSLDSEDIIYNQALKEFYESSSSGSGRSNYPEYSNGDGIQTLRTGETPISDYPAKVENSYSDYSDAAIVVLSRVAGENWDLPRVAYDNPDRHYLELDNNERDLLRHIGESNKFSKIVILINSSNYIDLGFLEERTSPSEYNDFGKYVDACIVIGSPGANGIMALGKILSGKVNPSGRTVDTIYTHYYLDPTWQNFGGNFTNNGDAYIKENGRASGYYSVEYEENIYLGYRYYETCGDIDGEAWYNDNVVYPFGYGLSYTTFDQEIVNVSTLVSSPLYAYELFDVQIRVENTGFVAGKQVVQLYAEAPYFYGIEKPYKVLVGFAKTKVLAPLETEVLTITVNPYDFASFDSQDKNFNGFMGYELEAGTYIFHAGTDAHHDFATFEKTLVNDEIFYRDPYTNETVVPLFQETTDHMEQGQNMSRMNMSETFPISITDEERTVSDNFINMLKVKETNNDEEYTIMPTTGASNGLSLKDLAYRDYEDPIWEDFIDQFTFEEMLKLFNEGCYSTARIERLGIPKTTSADGPAGLVSFLGNLEVYGTCYYCSECLVAQTYNLELAYKEGKAIGNECLIGNEKGDGRPYTNWYAPRVNLHRSPFSGRNTESYSEDPFLTGKFAAQVINGVQEKGVNAVVKNFALNEQETHRADNGIATWCDEQAMRELYLKPFEYAVKEGGARGVMSSFNRVGYEWAGGSYRLLTLILRNEWGFRGFVTSDFNTSSYMDAKQMLYAGGDLNLCGSEACKLITDTKAGASVSTSNPKDVMLLRRATKNICYALANSNIAEF